MDQPTFHWCVCVVSSILFMTTCSLPLPSLAAPVGLSVLFMQPLALYSRRSTLTAVLGRPGDRIACLGRRTPPLPLVERRL